MSKRIAIIGGGISGLTVLHYLKQRFGNNVDITLFEREASTGGTIRSFKKDSCLFEWGPNGFLNNQPSSLQLIEELGLKDQLITAQSSSSQRFIQIKGELVAIPTGLVEFIRTDLLSRADKFALLKGVFKKNISKDCSIYDYVRRRFSPGIAQTIVDPFISGIYAGDIKRLHMNSAFPKLKRKRFQKTKMCSFKGGMGQIIEALSNRYKMHIQTGSELQSLPVNNDITIIATPALDAAKIVKTSNPVLADLLNQVPYAPIAVAGLLFKQDSFKKKPVGFGYLIPSAEKKIVLGVLIESNVYVQRAGGDQTMIRVMLGGMHHPGIIDENQEQVLTLALKEIDHTYGLLSKPAETFIKVWPKAIAQYEINYPNWRESIAEQCAKTSGLYLCANYLDGISFNDCINNAKTIAGTVKV